jgi:hypothetical protein
MTRTPADLTWAERRAAYLRLKGYGLADIAWDMKLDGCLVSKKQAQREAKSILESAAAKLEEGET